MHLVDFLIFLAQKLCQGKNCFSYINVPFVQPVGALNPTRLDKILDRYESFDDPVIPQFHYGSHYSSAGTVR